MVAKAGERKRIAIIGAGIAGMGAALKLAEHHEVSLFEAERKLGGHARTRLVQGIAVDTGFIVFNRETYPRLTALFERLEVPVLETSMSFGFSHTDESYAYAMPNLSGLFAQLSNLGNPRHLSLIADLLKFNRRAKAALQPGMSLGDLLGQLQLGENFRDRFLLPLTGAIWSSSAEDMLNYPAESLLNFLDNHGLLSVYDQPQWYTVQGGSQVYVQRVEAQLRALGVTLFLGTQVQAVRRSPSLDVLLSGEHVLNFDALVLACHADQALRLLDDPSKSEWDVLSALPYRENRMVLHSDTRLMPRAKRAWASWNARESAEGLSFTYDMNRLQSLPAKLPLYVTLNPPRDQQPKKVHDEARLWHPQFDLGALAAQRRLPEIQGNLKTWYCGAYARHGFHEDGLWSGETAAQSVLTQLGAE